MFDILCHDEDSASAALSRLFIQCPRALAVFCNLVNPGGDWWTSGPPPEVENQHPSPGGRKIDILIRNRDRAIIVECKVLDAVKPFQLRTYYDYWFDRTG